MPDLGCSKTTTYLGIDLSKFNSRLDLASLPLSRQGCHSSITLPMFDRTLMV